MMTGWPDDLPARLVRRAARQLGDEERADRYAEEWLSSLPPRGGYQRWRYALSLSLRGARATRRAVGCPPARRRPTDAEWPRTVASIRNGTCPAMILAAVMLLTQYYFWNAPFWVSQYGHFIGWCLMIGALVALSFLYRGARWAAGCGVLVSLIQTWTGTAFLQGGGPVGTLAGKLLANVPGGSLEATFWPEPGTWYWAQEAACLGALFTGIAVIFGRRIPLVMRASAVLGVCALVVGAQTSFGVPMTTYFSNGPGSGVWEFLQFRFFFFSWDFAADCAWPGVVSRAVESIGAVIWGAQILAFGCLAGLARLCISRVRHLERGGRAS